MVEGKNRFYELLPPFVLARSRSRFAYISAVKGLDYSMSINILFQTLRQKKRSVDSLFPLQGNPIQDKDLGGQQKPCYFSIIQGDRKETHGTTPVHGSAGDIEWKAGDGSIHQDAEVIAQVRSGHPKRPHTRENENIARGEQSIRNVGLMNGLVVRLVCQGAGVKVVAVDAK